MYCCRLVWVVLAVCWGMQAWAEELQVRDAWVREAPPSANVHAAYMELVNNGDQAMIITSIVADDYSMTMLHKTVQKNGMAAMEHVDSLVIPAHASVKLEPGGLHIMLMKPGRKLQAGDSVKLTIRFDDDRHQETMALVRAAP